MVAVGLFLATVLWLGWDGGTVGATVVDGLHDAFGVAAYLIPLVLISVGVLMLVRSRLVDLKPFRTGLVVGAFGLMIALGRDEGGAIGGALGGALAHVIGETGALIVGVALFIAGTLLFTGASAGAVLRRSGSAMRNAGNAARRSLDTRDAPGRADDDSYDDARVTPRRAPVDAVMSYPDVIAPVASSAEAPPLVAQADEYTPDELTAGDGEEIDFETAPAGDYRLPERSLLKASPPVVGDNGVASAKIADQLVKTLSHFGVDATIVGQIAGPRVVRYELQLAPGDEGLEGRGPEGRSLLRAGDDRDPHPGADSRQAGGGRRGAEPLPEARHPGRHLRRHARSGEPALGVARQGHLRQCRLDRPRPHAAPAHRRHHRLR